MRKIKMNIVIVVSLLIFGLASCSSGPEPIKLGQESCAFCKMTISDNRYGAEIVTKKGRAYKFDDTHCVMAFMKANTINNDDIKETYLVNFEEPHNFILVQNAFLLKSNELHSPMGGNTAAFDDKTKMDAANVNIKGQGTVVTWEEMVKDN